MNAAARQATARRICAINAKAGDRVKTTDDFITGIASTSYVSGKSYMVKFADGHAQPPGDWLRARLAKTRKSKRGRSIPIRLAFTKP